MRSAVPSQDRPPPSEPNDQRRGALEGLDVMCPGGFPVGEPEDFEIPTSRTGVNTPEPAGLPATLMFTFVHLVGSCLSEAPASAGASLRSGCSPPSTVTPVTSVPTRVFRSSRPRVA